MSGTAETQGGKPAPRAAGRREAIAHYAALVAAALTVFATSGLDRWQVVPLLTIMAFTVVTDLAAIRMPNGMYVSGSFLGIVLAAVTLGGGPAAIIGVAGAGIGWLRSREPAYALRANLVTFAWFPLLTGLAFHAVVRVAGAAEPSLAFNLLVFVAFALALGLNFLVIASYERLRRGTPVAHVVREALVPLLAGEGFSALLTVAAVYIDVQLGIAGIAFCGLAFVIFQYLIGELLKSQRRGVALHRAATVDELTGLANRERFREMVEERIAVARAVGAKLSVLLMDLDRFKEINDTLGHDHGDALLRDLGPRLESAIGDGGVVARLGGDEFGILLPQDTDDPAVLEIVIGRLFKALSEPFKVEELALEVGASVGVARFPLDGDDASSLLRCADVAMYHAKETQTEYKLYAPERNRHSVRRLSVLSDIRHALASDQIVVHFQPIIDLDDLRVRGAEGLVRWQHPEHGLIPPGAFVQTIEQTGLIGPLTRHVLERSIAECASWRRDGRELSVGVNLSVRNLLDHDLPRQVQRLLAAHGLPAEALQLEITESMIMTDPERALATVSRLSALGVRLSVDDFGTGYSSLANLRKMPIDELKIDRSFVAPMLRDESDLIIVRSTINLGHDLGLNVIAEGVEDSATLTELAQLGCDHAQGYHVSRPMPAEAFNTWLAHVGGHAAERPAKGSPPSTSASPASLTRGAIDLARLVASPES